MIFGISKTTLNGVLALLITILTAVLAYQVPSALLTPQASHVWLIVTTICTFACGILRAVVGFLQNDTPEPGTTTTGATGTTKIGAAMLCFVLVSGLFASGCSGVKVAQDIVNWTPALQSAIASVNATAAVLDPAAAPIFAAATMGFDAASNTFVAQAKAYLANPSASVLQQLQTAVTTFQQSVNTALLSAAKITNPASQQKALAEINSVGTIVNILLSLVVSISSKSAVAQMAAESPIKLAQVAPYFSLNDMLYEQFIVAQHYNLPMGRISPALTDGEVQLQQAGF